VAPLRLGDFALNPAIGIEAQHRRGRVLPAGPRQEDVTIGGHVDAVDRILV
jgi:hypothetical protein